MHQSQSAYRGRGGCSHPVELTFRLTICFSPCYNGFMRLRTLFLISVLGGLIAGCGSLPVPRSTPRESSAQASPASGHEREGIASWYGGHFNGRRTANGEIYDMNLLTAAHKTLPFHSIVRVTRLDDGRAVMVRINDRGPFVAGRIIDLSFAAARRLGMDDEGTTQVRLHLVAETDTDLAPPVSRARIQAGAFSDRIHAQERERELNGRFEVVFRVKSENDLHRVLSAPMIRKEAESLCRRMRSAGFEAFVRGLP